MPGQRSGPSHFHPSTHQPPVIQDSYRKYCPFIQDIDGFPLKNIVMFHSSAIIIIIMIIVIIVIIVIIMIISLFIYICV